jgi:glycosyltransferase involved in cell wall biosynthesis
MGAVVYAETFGNPSEVWMWRQVRATGVPLLTHEHRNAATFPYERTAVVPRTRTPLDRARAAARWLRDRHGYRLPASTERAVERKLRDLKATFVHAHYGPAGLRMLPLPVPLLVTFHGFDTSSLPATDPSYRRALRRLFGRAAGIVAVSETVRERLVRLGCPTESLHVIPMGVPVGPPRPHPIRDEVRAITVARLHPVKGVPDLVDAVRKARAAGARIALDIVGDGTERADVERRIEAGGLRGTVRMHGTLPPAEVARLLDGSDLFVLNSRTTPEGDAEGLPVSLLEAMEASLPVVATRHGGIRDAVEEGKTGLLVAEKDTDAFAAALVRVAGDPELRARFGAAGRARVEREFDLERCAARLLEVYRKADL